MFQGYTHTHTLLHVAHTIMHTYTHTHNTSRAYASVQGVRDDFLNIMFALSPYHSFFISSSIKKIMLRRSQDFFSGEGEPVKKAKILENKSR